MGWRFCYTAASEQNRQAYRSSALDGGVQEGYLLVHALLCLLRSAACLRIHDPDDAKPGTLLFLVSRERVIETREHRCRGCSERLRERITSRFGLVPCFQRRWGGRPEGFPEDSAEFHAAALPSKLVSQPSMDPANRDEPLSGPVGSVCISAG